MTIRLSGNYIDRLLINVLPWIIGVTIVFYFINKNQKTIIATFLLSTMAFWLMDTLIIFFKYKNPKPLRYNKSLFWGTNVIAINEITKITPIIDKRSRWSFRMVEFSLSNGTTFMVIDKPQTIISDFANKPSKTVQLLVSIYPELKSRISTLKSI